MLLRAAQSSIVSYTFFFACDNRFTFGLTLFTILHKFFISFYLYMSYSCAFLHATELLRLKKTKIRHSLCAFVHFKQNISMTRSTLKTCKFNFNTTTTDTTLKLGTNFKRKREEKIVCICAIIYLRVSCCCFFFLPLSSLNFEIMNLKYKRLHCICWYF